MLYRSKRHDNYDIENKKIKGGRNMDAWEKFYGKEEEFRKEIFRIPHEDLPKFVKLLQKIKGKRVLDLGCGIGRPVIALVKEGFQVYGIDVSQSAIKETKERLEKEGLRAELKIGNIYKELPYEDNFFDGVISIKVLHHARVFKIKRLIKEIERVMKPGGILMVEVPRQEKGYVREGKEIEPGTIVKSTGSEKGVPHHIFTDEEELKEFFSNFEILDIRKTGEDKIQTPSPHYTMFAKLKGSN